MVEAGTTSTHEEAMRKILLGSIAALAIGFCCEASACDWGYSGGYGYGYRPISYGYGYRPAVYAGYHRRAYRGAVGYRHFGWRRGVRGFGFTGGSGRW
jgi:hypothetical protein